jgi:RNA polymerase sigma-70 factor, ECF subfamily
MDVAPGRATRRRRAVRPLSVTDLEGIRQAERMVLPCSVTVEAGPELDFAAIFEAEFDYVWNTLKRLGIRDADVEDQVHELFLRVHQQLARYDRARPLRPWLFAFAVRIAAEYRRLARNRREISGLPPELEAPEPGADDQLARAQVQAWVLQALETLSAEKRAVFVAVDIDGHSGPEVAAALEVPLNTVYSRLRLAREDFAAAMRRVQKRRGTP